MNATILALFLAATGQQVGHQSPQTYLSPSPAPAISPAAGTYPLNQTFTLSSTASGCVYYYTTNGTTPTTSSTVYSGPTAMGSSQTVKAISACPGYKASTAVASAAYTISSSLAPPTFSPATGTYTGTQAITVSCGLGVPVYTLDGTDPALLVKVPPPSFVSTGNVSVRAICAPYNWTSGIAEADASYVITPTYYASFSGSACQTTVSGTGIAVTNNRTSIAWVTKGGSESQCSANQNRIGDLGLLSELAATQYVANPDSPATQSPTLPTGGAFYSSITGAGSVALAAGTATTSSLPATTTAASPSVFGVSVSGTVVGTVSAPVTFWNITNWGKASSPIHSAMVRGSDGASFTTPAVSNNYCILTRSFAPWGGTFANLLGATGIFSMGWGTASQTSATISQIGTLVGNFYDSSSGLKSLTVTFSAAEMLTAHSLALCRSTGGAVSMFLDGISVGIPGGAGTGIASTTPPTPTYVGLTATATNGPIWIADVGLNTDSTSPGISLEIRTRIDALGDSITYGLGATTPYPAVLLNMLGANYLMTNSGVSGQVTSQILSRYQTGQIQDRRYRNLLVLAGINDIRTDVAVATIESNLQAIYDAHRSQGGKLIIATMLPWNGWGDYTGGRETNRQTVNTWIRAYATTNGVPLVDLSASFDNGSGYIKSAWNQDYLHPNQAGYNEIATEFYNAGHAQGYW